MTDVFSNARTYVRTEGRIVERRLFATLFEGAPATGVSAALGAYRNADGGFGHGLEPDKRCPASLPLDCEIAFETLAAVWHADPELLGPACDFLAGLATADSPASEGAVPMCLPVIEDYPRADHMTDWTYAPGVNPTTGLAGLLHELDFAHPWRDRASAYSWKVLESGDFPSDAHALKEMLVFLAHVPERDRAAKHAPAVIEVLLKNDLFQPEPRPGAYGLTPLDIATTADSPWRSLFPEAAITAHLDKLQADQQDDGGWPITWDPPGTESRLAWRGRVTIDALRTLSSFGRITVPDQP